MNLPDLTGKTLLVTGATNGVGKETARLLAQAGARVLIVGRSSQKLSAAAEDLQTGARGEVVPLLADLSLLSQVKALAAQVLGRVDRLDGLLLNAAAASSTRQVTSEGIEQTFALNHLAGMLLAGELRPLLEASAPARILIMSSAMHNFIQRIPWDNLEGQRRYSGIGQAYNLSKLENLLFMRALARRMAGSGVTVNALHPGLIRTGFARRGGDLMSVWLTAAEWLIALTPKQAARAPLRLLSDPAMNATSGVYFEYDQPASPSPLVDDLEAQERLWALSEARIAEGLAAAEQGRNLLAEQHVGDEADADRNQRVADQ